MKRPDSQLLFVAWQDAASGQIIPVGRLLRLEQGYEFAYIASVRKAEALGFAPLVTFPELASVYRSAQLPPLFSNRLMSASRRDFAEHLQRLGMSESEAEPFTILARSAGRRETDKLEVFAPPQVVGDIAEGVFLVRGLRHIPGAEAAAEQLQQGARLFVMVDVQNEVNPAALALRTERRELLGYVPDYLARELANHDLPGSLLQVEVKQVNPAPAPVHHRLLCQFKYSQQGGPELFTGADYQPVSSVATAAE